MLSEDGATPSKCEPPHVGSYNLSGRLSEGRHSTTTACIGGASPMQSGAPRAPGCLSTVLAISIYRAVTETGLVSGPGVVSSIARTWYV